MEKEDLDGKKAIQKYLSEIMLIWLLMQKIKKYKEKKKK